jgi:hypothetical protein
MGLQGVNRFAQVDVLSGVPGATEYGIQRDQYFPRLPIVQFDSAVASATVALHVTNFYDFGTSVGTHWMAVFSSEAPAGVSYVFSGGLWAAYRVTVNSAAEELSYTFGR